MRLLSAPITVILGLTVLVCPIQAKNVFSLSLSIDSNGGYHRWIGNRALRRDLDTPTVVVTTATVGTEDSVTKG